MQHWLGSSMAVEAGAMVVDDLVSLHVLLVVLAARPALGGGAQHGVRGHGRVAGEASGRLHCHYQVARVRHYHVSHLVKKKDKDFEKSHICGTFEPLWIFAERRRLPFSEGVQSEEELIQYIEHEYPQYTI